MYLCRIVEYLRVPVPLLVRVFTLMDTVRYGYSNMVDFSFIVSLYVSDLPNVTISIYSFTTSWLRQWGRLRSTVTCEEHVILKGSVTDTLTGEVEASPRIQVTSLRVEIRGIRNVE